MQVLDNRTAAGASGKELLAWARCISFACKEVGPLVSGQEMGQDQLQPWFENVVSNTCPVRAITANLRMMETSTSMLEQGWMMDVSA